MVLLTSGQVSVAISSGIVIIFTTLLFLAGYILQQQTVASLSIAVRPRIPKPIVPPSLAFDPSHKLSRLPGSAQQPIDDELQQYLATVTRGSTDWSRLAHVQLVTTHHDVCTALMFFAELKRLKSPARRILLFPASWTQDMSESDAPSLPRTRRLLRAAARRYNVSLRALGSLNPTPQSSSSSFYDPDLDPTQTPSLASLWSFTPDFDRVLHLRGPGLLLDSEPLDALLAFAPPTKLSASAEIIRGVQSPRIATDLLLATPSKSVYDELNTARAQDPMLDDTELLRKVFMGSEALLKSSSYYRPEIWRDTASLRIPMAGVSEETGAEGFNATEFLDQTAYIKFTDPEIPGPEYDVPYGVRADYRPKEDGPRLVWDRLYEVFRQRRMEVCGLDLEGWVRPVEKGSDENLGSGVDKMDMIAPAEEPQQEL